MNLNEITYRQIESLTDVQLSAVLLNLLKREAAERQFSSVRELIVQLKINVADGGQDGKIDCEDTRGSIYVQNKLSVFQCKASKMEKGAIYSEFFREKVDKKGSLPTVLVLKGGIKEVLDAGGQYVFFINQPYSPVHKKLREQAAQQAIDDYNSIHSTGYQAGQVRIMDAHEITQWVNQFIDVVIRVQEYNHIQRLAGLQTLDELGYLPEIYEIPFHSNPSLDEYMTKISEVANNPRATLRIIGHSGLGKTRLVYEAFKRSKNNSALYYKIESHPQDIVNFVITYGTYYTGLLIVDNCDLNAHRLLKQQIDRLNSSFKLITVDFNVSEETDASASYGQEYLFLNKNDYRDIVKMILTDEYQNKLGAAQIDQIANYAEGYPGMAVLFANARLDGRANLSELLKDDIIFRIAFGRDWNNHDKGMLELLKAVSVFGSFFKPAPGSEDIVSPQEAKLAEDQASFITTHVCQPVKTILEYRKGTDYFERSRVMERRGHYLMVKPTPLAIKLATEWWRYTDARQLIQWFPEMERIGLALPLVNRLAELDQLSHAKRIVNQIWGPKSPFGSAEVLNSSLGSRIFRSVAPVNPESALETLQQAFGNMSTDELKSKVRTGRRNIIWAMEMLVFEPGLFEEVALLFFKFALAENENIVNNATGQFLQLFHVILPGTAADLNQRLAVIDKIMETSTGDAYHLGVVALCRGMKGDTFRRDIGAENRGTSAPLKDFEPTWVEMAGYWENIIQRLVEVAKNHESERKLIKSTFAGSIRNLFYNRMPFLVEKAVLLILAFDRSYWDQAISEIKTTIAYEFLNEEDIKLTDRLLAELKPVTLADQFRFYVSSPVWNFEARDEEEPVDHTEIAAQQFAERLVWEHVDLRELMEQMQSGEQRKSYIFGRTLGKMLQDVGFAENLLHILAKIAPEKQNIEVAAAYISTLTDDAKHDLFSLIRQTPEIAIHAFYVARVIALPLSELLPLFDLVEQQIAGIDYFYQFTYGRGLDALSEKEVLTFFEKISTYSGGEMLALELSQEYIGKITERRLLFHDFLLKLIKGNNLLLQRGRNSNYAWQTMITWLIDEAGEAAFTPVLIPQLIEAAQTDRISAFDGYLTSIIRRLIEKDFAVFWDLIAPSILSNDYINLRFFMGAHNGNMGTPGLLDKADIPTLINWCKTAPEMGLLRIARMMPVTPIGNTREWHPLAKAMIDNFGSSAKLLHEIGGNVNSFGSVGSRVPYLQDQKELISKLSDHPIERVKKWAKSFIKQKETEIKRTMVEEQSYYINI
ncbi:hypothetical protein SAMN05421821_10697 [Mucilaginibacter lappiensis]|uniref:Restriction endonuclease n=1 Tax=Mucilaginibacter lappiensis TaxID=354630 RepID=A0ABR6PKN5_9SPHI|nr:hypothetical protein [Mucilaginibacter lappiensis]MBB6110290.1 hypothetical protein [Mucilaginibacter lappiensis]SIR29322.1 hypothetical protein SAMN05421821_10697 [Mucilaginibacter lappiensis]